LARTALQLDPNHPEVHAYLGVVFVCQRQFDAAIAEVEKAIALNPNFSHLQFPMVLLAAGEPARVIEAVERHMRLDPFHAPQASGWMGMAFYLRGEYSRALSPLQECALRAPNFLGGHLWLAATHAQLGELKEARMRAAEVLRIQPDWSIATCPHTLVFRYPEHVEHLFDGLRKAGLPET
jgi:adenylate cyclase